MSRISIVRHDNTVGGLVGSFVIVRQGPQKAKVHVEFHATRWDAFYSVLCHLFMDVGLFFEVDIMERVVFEHRRGTNNILQKHIELVFAW